MSTDIYTKRHTVLASEADCFRCLKISSLFTIMQEIGIDHTEKMGFGHIKTLDRGILWIITHQHAVIHRMPKHLEEITINTWAGPMAHMLFPRYFEFLDNAGNVLVKSVSLWALMNQEDRHIVNPLEQGIIIESAGRSGCLPFPRVPAMAPTQECFSFTVPFSYLDLNGHMNNARYFDLAEDHIEEAALGHEVKDVSIEYRGEIKYRQNVNINIGRSENIYTLYGQDQITNQFLFRMRISY